VRLSRSRLLLRAALLLFLAGFMAWRARDTVRSAAEAGLDPAAALLLSRIALLEWFLAGLAALTAGAALFALRRRPRAHTLHLGGDAATPPDPPSTGG